MGSSPMGAPPFGSPWVFHSKTKGVPSQNEQNSCHRRPPQLGSTGWHPLAPNKRGTARARSPTPPPHELKTTRTCTSRYLACSIACPKDPSTAHAKNSRFQDTTNRDKKRVPRQQQMARPALWLLGLGCPKSCQSCFGRTETLQLYSKGLGACIKSWHRIHPQGTVGEKSADVKAKCGNPRISI